MIRTSTDTILSIDLDLDGKDISEDDDAQSIVSDGKQYTNYKDIEDDVKRHNAHKDTKDDAKTHTIGNDTDLEDYVNKHTLARTWGHGSTRRDD